jgi:hypothetical protein
MPVDLRGAQGQASLEWLAMIAVVAALIVFGPAFAHADQIGRRVTREWVRALCLVRHGDCQRDRDPCVVSATQKREGLSVDVAFVHLGDHRVVRIERRSDGTYALTLGAESALGLQAYAGVGANVDVAGVSAAISLGVAAAETLTREGGQTWVTRSAEQAQDLLGRLQAGRDVPRPDVEYATTDLHSTLGATLEADAIVHLDLGGAELAFDRRAGQRLDRRTGRRTLYVRSRRDGQAGVGDGVLGVSGGAGGEVYAVELDASGRPLDLQVVTTGAFSGSRDLPSVVAPVVGRLDFEADGQRTYEVTAHLDLTEPGNLAAAADLLAAVTRRGLHVGAAPAATRALRRRIDERGTVEARVLSTRSSSFTLGLGASLGGKLGAEVSRTSASTQLVAAVSRGLDGQWLVRDDCANPA